MVNIEKIANSFTDDIMAIINEFDNINGIQNAFSNDGIGKSQLDILLKAVRKANSIDEIILYISYQKSKSKNGRSWRYNLNGSTLADKLIEKVKEVIDLVSEENLENHNLNLDLEKIRLLKLKICEKFFGYFYWKGSVYANL